VKRAIAILFLSTYLLSTTQLGELLKLPMLIEHFIEHKAENKAISFFTFLQMHYFNGDPKDADYDKDMKLPFKTVNVNPTAIAFCYNPNFSFNFSKPTFATIFKQKFPRTAVHFSSSYLDAIWQPPRLV
jgi:hypothetical protein